MKHPAFTIKQVHDNGAVSIWPAYSVFQHPVMDRPADADRGIASLAREITFDMGDDVQGSVSQGVAYIMNAAGKTIDTVHLPIEQS